MLRTITVTGLNGLNGTYISDIPIVDGCISWDNPGTTTGPWAVIGTQLNQFAPVTQEHRHTLSASAQLNLIASLPQIALGSNFRNPAPAFPFDSSYRYQNGSCPFWTSVTTVSPNISHGVEGEFSLQMCRDYAGTRGVFSTRAVSSLVRQSDPALAVQNLFTATFTFSLEIT
jgi:hypothetical protein